jgi:Lipoprotein LpqB beta-propeller domain/Sporulation and spore germination
LARVARRPGGTGSRRRFRKPAELAAELATIGIAALLAGCATVPANTAPKTVSAGGSHVQAYVQPLPPPPPTSSWTAREVVLGFLHASASYAFDPAAARKYLIPSLGRTWKPGPVTIVSSTGEPTTHKYPAQLGAYPGQQEIVRFTGQRLATLSQSGQYQYIPGSAPYEFTLDQVNGTWLISELPQSLSNSLLLLESDFEHVYQPRNLFFFATTSPFAPNGELVPDPVYAPLESSSSALNTNVAAGLARGLLQDRGSWLDGATWTAFPPHTTLLGVTISGQTAIVNLGGAAVHASFTAKTEMVEQLKATLGSEAYAPALARNVELEINGKVPTTGAPSEPIYKVDTGPSSPSLYDLNGQGEVSIFGARSPLLSPDLADQTDVTAIAAAPFVSLLAGSVAAATTTAAGGCTVVVGDPRQPARIVHLSASGDACASLSWDSNGNLWAVAGDSIWMLDAHSKHLRPELVRPPKNLPGDGRSGLDIRALRMAPDGVRAAFLIQTGRNTTSLVLAAVSYQGGRASFGRPVDAGPADPIALAWYNPYELLVLTASGIREVPMTGAAGQPVGTLPADAVSITTNGTTVAVGTSTGIDQDQIYTSDNLGGFWAGPQPGSLPAYPG